MKNISMLGGALIITYFGSGPLSLDNVFSKKINQRQQISVPASREPRKAASTV
jgi:hypothetical protein